MTATKRWRPFLVAMIAGVLVGLLTPPAYAHYVKSKGRTFDGGKWCVEVEAEVSHGSWGKGYTSSRTLAKEDFWGPWEAHCGDQWQRVAGKIAATYDYLKWSETRGQWELCRYTGWHLNSSRDDSMQVSYDRSSLPCGVGWYATVGVGAIKMNGQWHGYQDGIYSGDHYLY